MDSLLKRCATHGERQWQKDHWKGKDAKKEAKKHNQDSIEIRWINDAENRESQTKIGWTREYCPYLDFLTTIGISYCATWEAAKPIRKQPCTARKRRPAPKSKGTIFRKPHADGAALQRERGRVHLYIPKVERERQRPINETLRADLQ